MYIVQSSLYMSSLVQFVPEFTLEVTCCTMYTKYKALLYNAMSMWLSLVLCNESRSKNTHLASTYLNSSGTRFIVKTITSQQLILIIIL